MRESRRGKAQRNARYHLKIELPNAHSIAFTPVDIEFLARPLAQLSVKMLSSRKTRCLVGVRKLAREIMAAWGRYLRHVGRCKAYHVGTLVFTAGKVEIVSRTRRKNIFIGINRHDDHWILQFPSKNLARECLARVLEEFLSRGSPFRKRIHISDALASHLASCIAQTDGFVHYHDLVRQPEKWAIKIWLGGYMSYSKKYLVHGQRCQVLDIRCSEDSSGIVCKYRTHHRTFPYHLVGGIITQSVPSEYWFLVLQGVEIVHREDLRTASQALAIPWLSAVLKYMRNFSRNTIRRILLEVAQNELTKERQAHELMEARRRLGRQRASRPKADYARGK